MHHRTITAYLEPTGLRTSTFEGRQHLVAPVVLMVGDIVVAPVTGDGRGEFVPSSVLQQAPSQWDGRPVIPGHPPAGSANTPARLEARRIGQLSPLASLAAVWSQRHGSTQPEPSR